MKQTGKMPNHGDWFIEDQTRTDNGYLLMRYCAVLPYIGWHHYGFFPDRETAIQAKLRYRDLQAGGAPWPDRDAVAIDRMREADARRGNEATDRSVEI